MARSKYINTFDTTSEFNTYIASQNASFPNVALTKDNNTIHYTATAPSNN
jgi:hypothetical protein